MSLAGLYVKQAGLQADQIARVITQTLKTLSQA